MDTFSVLYPQIQDVAFRTQATSLDVPVYPVEGRHEAPGRAQLAKQWLALLEAPSKKPTTFDSSGHRPLWEQPERFHDLMTGTVLAETTHHVIPAAQISTTEGKPHPAPRGLIARRERL